jgi:hypothetical protein
MVTSVSGGRSQRTHREPPTMGKQLFAQFAKVKFYACVSYQQNLFHGKLSYKTEFKDGSVSFSESFHPDDPSLIDRHPDYCRPW